MRKENRIAASSRCASVFLWLTFFLLPLTTLPALGSDLTTKERVIFFPSLARPTGTNWQVEIHGWVYQEQNKWLAPVFRRVIGINEDELTATEKARLHERCQFFLEDNERRKSVSIVLAGNTNRVGPSKANGHFSTFLTLDEETIQKLKNVPGTSNGLARFEFLAPNQVSPLAAGTIHLLDDTGVSVISDIDDTIKISQCWDKKQLMQNTFCRPYLAVPGMAAVYQSWQRSSGAQFHYVSAMPWQLYLPISGFIRSNGFPQGTFHCRYFRLKDTSLFNLLRSPEKYKRETIDQLLQMFPRRQFILVGDSGEKDPEVYAALARKYPRQVRRIFIRDVTGETSKSPRYKKVFDGLPSQSWQVFKDSRELPNDIR